MKYDVPQPSTATRSPGSGRPDDDTERARRHIAGWLAISSLRNVTTTRCEA